MILQLRVEDDCWNMFPNRTFIYSLTKTNTVSSRTALTYLLPVNFVTLLCLFAVSSLFERKTFFNPLIRCFRCCVFLHELFFVRFPIFIHFITHHSLSCIPPPYRSNKQSMLVRHLCDAKFSSSLQNFEKKTFSWIVSRRFCPHSTSIALCLIEKFIFDPFVSFPPHIHAHAHRASFIQRVPTFGARNCKHRRENEEKKRIPLQILTRAQLIFETVTNMLLLLLLEPRLFPHISSLIHVR